MSDTEQPTQTKKPSIGAIGFVIAILVLTAVGSLLNDSQSTPHATFIGPITVMGVMWGSAFFSFFIAWMLYYAYYILPGSSLAQWRSGFRLLGRYYLRQPATYIDYLSSKSHLRKKERTRRSVKEKEEIESPKPFYEHSFDQLGAGVVPTHIALALDKTSKKRSLQSLATTPPHKIQHGKPLAFSRAAGPGIVILNGNVRRKTETIMRKIDLRPHLRIEPVEAMTRDGIRVKTKVIVLFHVNRADDDKATTNNQDNDKKHYALYPYKEEDIRRIRYDHKDEWYAHIAPRAVVLLADELSSLALDELHDAEGATIQRLRKIVRDNLDKQLNPTTTIINDDGEEVTTKKNSGITIVMVNLFPIEEPKKIQKHRLNLWQTEMEEEIEVLKLKRQADSAKEIQRMRAEKQINIVNNFISSIQSMYDAQNVTPSEIVTLRMIAALEEAMKNKDLMVMTPQMLTYWLTDTIKQIHLLLDEDVEK